jgi:uncharacterized protein (UPF0335 family)
VEPDSYGGIIARLDRVEQDYQSSARDRSDIWKELNSQGREQGKLSVHIEEIQSDVAEIKESTKWVLRALVGAIITFTGLIVTILVAVFANA